jgi:hypothetical protein
MCSSIDGVLSVRKCTKQDEPGVRGFGESRLFGDMERRPCVGIVRGASRRTSPRLESGSCRSPATASAYERQRVVERRNREDRQGGPAAKTPVREAFTIRRDVAGTKEDFSPWRPVEGRCNVSLNQKRRGKADVWRVAGFLIVLCAGSCSRSSDAVPGLPLPPSPSAQPPSGTVAPRAVEEPSHSFEVGRPTANEIARALTAPPCRLAYGDERFNGLLVRVTGTYTVIEGPLLLVEGCERLVFLEFDDGRIERLTPEGNRQFTEATTDDSLIDVVLVGRARTRQSSPADRYGELMVYAIESVARRR